MILELSQNFHGIHFETAHLSSIQLSLFTSRQNIQLQYRFGASHGQGDMTQPSRIGLDWDFEPLVVTMAFGYTTYNHTLS